ncbi:hypothetical protein GCM10023258_32310 [Terrabacter aeriphilus]|uniref:Uncharacterized protein n=1 Tax=Terrabacter aeriphilus TaxID=515662 RepID=A0ABP9JK10_9MICO
MSDQPSHAPDPTRDTTGEAAEPAASAPHDAPTAEDVPTPGDVPAYDRTFGLEAAEPSWVPQRADDETATARKAAGAQGTPGTPEAPRDPEGTTTHVGPASGGIHRTARTITLPRPAARLLGGRLRAWHVVAVVVGLFVPLGLWAAIDGADDLDPLSSPARVAPRRPAVTRTFPTPQVPTVTRPTAPTAPTGAVPTRGAMTAPPLVKVPTVPVTPVPTDARTIRFEAQAEGGTRVEVALSDATHQRHDFAAQPAPLAFDVPVPAAVTSKDYFSLRVRAAGAAGTTSADRPTVVCRVLVDGVLVTSQQGRGYATCYLSPYYDLRRR